MTRRLQRATALHETRSLAMVVRLLETAIDHDDTKRIRELLDGAKAHLNQVDRECALLITEPRRTP